MKVPFLKMNGCGNDFVIIDDRGPPLLLRPDIMTFHELVKLLADRNNPTTKGCDQVILLEKSEKYFLRMRIYNPDGSEAQACGNAARCVAAQMMEPGDEQIIETIERKLTCLTSRDNDAAVNMGKINFYGKIDLGSEYAELGQAFSVDIGNPHCIFIVDNIDKITDKYLADWGSKIENHPLFPERTNVEFVSATKDEYFFRARVWERGAGITKACGSGASAVSWVLKEKNLINPENFAYIEMDGGELEIFIKKDGEILLYGKTELEFADIIETMEI